ncbi:hypothetical protein [Burkholderia stagnalis]|uniref:hypothetical protein n=1 Tax=Burkholderia stagnalis TaxID=1503054 RepID=UPI000A6A70F6|nr:hypothetical protein [Burkholderia stagnalis]
MPAVEPTIAQILPERMSISGILIRRSVGTARRPHAPSAGTRPAPFKEKRKCA